MSKSKFQDKVCYVYVKNPSNVAVGLTYKSQYKTGHYLTVCDSNKINSGSSHNLILVNNNPIKNIELLNQRTVLIDNKYFYFVDTDFIADLAFNSLVKENKKIDGEYIFHKKSGKYKLLRVGGEEYNRIKDLERRYNLKKISKKDLVPGTIYVTPGNKKYLYLGAVNTINIPWSSDSKISKQSIKNKTLFYRLYDNENIGDNVSFLDKSNFTNSLYYKLEIKKTHSFVESIRKLNIDSNIIDNIRELSIKDFKSALVDLSNSGNNKNNFLWSYRKFCSWINLHSVNCETFKEFDVEKYMIFS